MTLILALAAALSLVPQGDAASTQLRPNLTGTWVPVDPAIAEYEVRIEQAGNSLTIETPVFRVRGSTNAPMTSTRVGMHREEFALNGSEVLHGVVGRVAPQSTSGPASEASVSRAAWAGNRVIILTHTTITSSPPWRDPAVVPRRQTVWQSYSIDVDRQLVVERLMTVDPMPSSYAQSPPVMTRVVYRKN